MSPVVIVVIVVVAVVIVAAVAVTNARRRSDGVDSFRRQIDALSPEARRTVVDQVQNAAERREQAAGDDESDDPDDDPHDDADGPRGT